jgi:hypothetical protein
MTGPLWPNLASRRVVAQRLCTLLHFAAQADAARGTDRTVRVLLEAKADVRSMDAVSLAKRKLHGMAKCNCTFVRERGRPGLEARRGPLARDRGAKLC